MDIRDNFHQLIDTIEDQELLEIFYRLTESLRDGRNGQLWDSLSEGQRKELLMAYEESFDERNLIAHEDIKLQYEKWLKP